MHDEADLRQNSLLSLMNARTFLALALADTAWRD